MNQQVEQADLKYRTPLYPIVPIVAFSFNFLTFVSLAFIPDQRISLSLRDSIYNHLLHFIPN